jgi:Fe(3+) dicitrate transport protein
VNWNIAALNMDYTISEKSRLNIKSFGMVGYRNSIGFMQTPNIRDTINASTLQFSNRRVDVDQYRNAGIEARYINDFQIGKLKNTISSGVRYFKGNTYRLQNGKGDTGNDYNINVSGSYPTDLHFQTSNAAFFAENIIRISENFILIPGFRVENIMNTASGRLNFSGNSELKLNAEQRRRNFVLPGIGAEYHIGLTEIYANYAKAYRPVLFSDLTANPTTDVIDQQLKDAQGYNIDLGYRGRLKDYLFFDVSAYWLQYNIRIGLIAQQKADGSFYNLRTNVGNSSSKGIEALVEFSPIKAFLKNTQFGNITLFTSIALIDARYRDFKVITRQGNNLVESNLNNKRVENAPANIIRSGITYTKKKITLTVQHSAIDESFSDANNTSIPTANGVNGIIPAYQLTDFSGNYTISEKFFIKAGVNNLGNKKYFTRRAGGYPGPGLMPAEPRNFFVTVGLKY